MAEAERASSLDEFLLGDALDLRIDSPRRFLVQISFCGATSLA